MSLFARAVLLALKLHIGETETNRQANANASRLRKLPKLSEWGFESSADGRHGREYVG
jgi:hypothetical protein